MARRWFSKPRIGLALSGGGARGLAHLGVLQALEELGVVPSAISGTSAGSIFGALRAANLPAARIVEVATTAQWLKLARPVLPGASGLFTLEPLERLLEQELGRQRSFRELPIPFACVATDIERDEPVILTEGPLAPAVRASCSVPGIFTPVEHQGRLLVDGGVVNNLPVRLLQSMGADYVIAVDLLPRRTTHSKSKGWVDLMTVTFYNMVRSTSHEGLLADVLVVPDIRAFGFADFSGRALLIERGREATLLHRDRLTRDLALGPQRGFWPNLRGALASALHRTLAKLRFTAAMVRWTGRTLTDGRKALPLPATADARVEPPRDHDPADG